MPGAPKKSKSTDAKTAQTGMMTGLDYVGRQNITPKKGVDPDEDYDEENVKSVEVESPTKEEAEVASRQEKFRKALLTAKGGKKRKHNVSKKTRKNKKTKRRS
jgi:hypothetical protein